MDVTLSDGTCRLLGGWFAFMVQGCLGVLCVATLVVKRQTEVPRRDWCVWFLDAMKQGIGNSLGHFSNIALSVVIASRIKDADECQWYCLAFVMDSIVGTLINIICISLIEMLGRKYPNWTCLKFGEYGNPPSLCVFLPQLFLWIMIMATSKVSVLSILIEFMFAFDKMISFLFQHFKSHPQIELIFVMIVVPVIFNTVQLWVQDTFLKRQEQLHPHMPLLQSDLDEDLVQDEGGTHEAPNTKEHSFLGTTKSLLPQPHPRGVPTSRDRLPVPWSRRMIGGPMAWPSPSNLVSRITSLQHSGLNFTGVPTRSKLSPTPTPRPVGGDSDEEWEL